MKSNQGIITDKEMAALRRFWNKKGFFGEPDKEAIERSSLKMQKLVKALKALSPEEIKKIRAMEYQDSRLVGAKYLVWSASESDINHAISTFKIF